MWDQKTKTIKFKNSDFPIIAGSNGGNCNLLDAFHGTCLWVISKNETLRFLLQVLLSEKIGWGYVGAHVHWFQHETYTSEMSENTGFHQSTLRPFPTTLSCPDANWRPEHRADYELNNDTRFTSLQLIVF